MAWLCKDPDGQELMFGEKPYRSDFYYWAYSYYVERGNFAIELPPGSIRKLLGYDLTWADEPVQLT